MFQVLKSIILLFFLLPLPLHAIEIPDPEGYVTDKAHVLTPEEKNTLDGLLGEFEEKSKAQIFILILKNLDEGNLEDYSIRLASQWKAGGKDTDNGIIILIVTEGEERGARIEVGYGLEDVVTDFKSSQIVREKMLPAFKNNDYAGGIKIAILSLAQLIIDTPLSENPQKNTKLTAKEIQGLFVIVITLSIMITLLDCLRYFFYTRSHKNIPSKFTAVEWWLRFAWLLSFFSLILRIALSAASSKIGSGKSRGFSGGGGGGFGGGGASGRW